MIWRALRRKALLSTGAITMCSLHREVMIRVGDKEKEQHARARATNVIKRTGHMLMQQTLMTTIDETLIASADNECVHCSYLKDA